MAPKAEKAPPLPQTPDELWRRDGNSLRVDGDEYDAWRRGHNNAVGQATREARRARLVANELEAAAERMQFDQQHPDCVPGRPQRGYNAFQFVSIGLQVFLVVAVLAMAARMLRPALPATTPSNAFPAFETAMPE